MRKHYEKRNIKLTVRVNKQEYSKLSRLSSHYHLKHSAYMAKLLDNTDTAKDSKNPRHLVNQVDAEFAIHRLAGIYDKLDTFRLDYARAFANLEHDNNLFNHGQLSSIPANTLRTAESACLTNKKSIQAIEKQISSIEMTLYDN